MHSWQMSCFRFRRWQSTDECNGVADSRARRLLRHATLGRRHFFNNQLSTITENSRVVPNSFERSRGALEPAYLAPRASGDYFCYVVFNHAKPQIIGFVSKYTHV